MPDRDYFMRSDRLMFGIWHDDDMPMAMAVWGDPEVTRLTGGPFTAAQVRDRLDAEIRNLALYGSQYWPIFSATNAELVGCCGLRPRDPALHVFELGFQLCRHAWGNGYAPESAQAVIEWAGENQIRTLVAGHHPDNHASAATLKRLGFTYTHDEFYPPTETMEPCYRLTL